MFLVTSWIVSAHSNEVRCYVKNEDVVGAAPTGDAPTTSEWSTISLSTAYAPYTRGLKVGISIPDSPPPILPWQPGLTQHHLFMRTQRADHSWVATEYPYNTTYTTDQ